MDALYQRCRGEVLVQHLCLGGTALLVLDGGIEDAQTVEFHADALCHQFGHALRDLHQHCLDGVQSCQTAVLLQVLGQAACRQRLTSVHLGKVVATARHTAVRLLAVVDTHRNFVCCHTFKCF